MTGKVRTVISVNSPLPQKIDLGFWVIDVRYVGEKRIREEVECEPDEETPEGAWCTDEDTIYILRSLSLARKRYVICHELIHAALDLRDGLARAKDVPK